MQIVTYPHPTLTRVSKPLRRVDSELHGLVREMFELMYAAKGVGLAANQVDLPYRLFIVNLSADPAQKDQEHVFINPVLSHPKGMEDAEEGCLSVPGVWAYVKRPQKVTISAYNLAGQEFCGELSGLFSRVVQHETDHLDGVLFIDRLSPTARMEIRNAMEEMEVNYDGRRSRGEIPADEEIFERLKKLEGLRT